MVEQDHPNVDVSKGFSQGRLPLYGYVGIGIILGAEILLFSEVPFVSTYFTAIVWTGYILFIDALNAKVHGRSLLLARPVEFALMLPWSVLCWLVFEAYNVYLQNWTYVGLPKNLVYRWIGYVWSFATIFPAILGTSNFCRPFYEAVRIRPFEPTNRLLLGSLVIGVVFLILPLIVEQHVASQLFALVWVGFALVLEPINYWMGGPSILRELREGRTATLLSLFTAGLVCGVLWEFWNYWAAAKWIYSVPISFAGPKIFEMPMLGYFGFLAFAVEVYSLWSFMAIIVFRKQLVPSSS